MDGDMILPEGFEMPQPEGSEQVEQPQETIDDGTETLETGEDTKPPVEEEHPSEVTQQPQKVKIKFNHEERELDLDEAAALAQKGMNYEKAVERARQEARDAAIAEMGFKWNGKPITTEAEYKQAKQEERIYQEARKLVENEGISEELAERMVKLELRDAEREREAQREKAAKEEETKQQESFREFFDYFQSVNERAFDPAKDTIPDEVRAAVEKGQQLKYAYMEHHNKELRNRLKVANQNQENKRKAPIGSVTTNGTNKAEAEDLFLKGFNSI